MAAAGGRERLCKGPLVDLVRAAAIVEIQQLAIGYVVGIDRATGVRRCEDATRR
jgi:hypothetical protein